MHVPSSIFFLCDEPPSVGSHLGLPVLVCPSLRLRSSTWEPRVRTAFYMFPRDQRPEWIKRDMQRWDRYIPKSSIWTRHLDERVLHKVVVFPAHFNDMLKLTSWPPLQKVGFGRGQQQSSRQHSVHDLSKLVIYLSVRCAGYAFAVCTYVEGAQVSCKAHGNLPLVRFLRFRCP